MDSYTLSLLLIEMTENAVDQSDERGQQVSGRIAMVGEWSVREPLYSDSNHSRVVGKFGTKVFPAKQGVKPVPPRGGWVMGINTYTKQKELPWDYI
jgi:multiple sugar transport system substrate-binding protein